jgi:hypothetical protein
MLIGSCDVANQNSVFAAAAVKKYRHVCGVGPVVPVIDHQSPWIAIDEIV